MVGAGATMVLERDWRNKSKSPNVAPKVPVVFNDLEGVANPTRNTDAEVVSKMHDNQDCQCKNSKLRSTLRANGSAQNGPPGLVLTFSETSCHAVCNDEISCNLVWTTNLCK